MKEIKRPAFIHLLRAHEYSFIVTIVDDQCQCVSKVLTITTPEQPLNSSGIKIKCTTEQCETFEVFSTVPDEVETRKLFSNSKPDLKMAMKFGDIRVQYLPDKTTGDLVDLYYFWKLLPRAVHVRFAMKEQRNTWNWMNSTCASHSSHNAAVISCV